MESLNEAENDYRKWPTRGFLLCAHADETTFFIFAETITVFTAEKKKKVTLVDGSAPAIL